MPSNQIRTGPGFNPETFKSWLSQTGILRNHDFYLIIPPPTGLPSNYQQTIQGIQYACDTINFPTTSEQTYQMQRYGYGAFETRPLYPHFNTITATLFCDNQANMMNFFQDWVKLIANYNFDNVGMNGNSFDGLNTYELSYKSTYVSDINLLIYNEIGTVVRNVSFRDAFPVGVLDMPLSWGRLGEQLKIPVTFAFTDFYSNS